MDEATLLTTLNSLIPHTLMETLQMQFTQWQKGELCASMPVNSRVHQPYGVLHGGATIALIETVASVISVLQFPQPEKVKVYGTQLSVNHINSVKEGTIEARAKMVKAGKNIHVVSVEVFDELQNLISIATQTNTIKLKEEK